MDAAGLAATITTPLCCFVRAELVEHLDGQRTRVGLGSEHQRRSHPNQHALGDTCRPMAADIAGHLATAGGVTC
jgi:hypothetical protein